MPSSSNSMPPGTFFSKAVEEKYNTNTSKRPFCMEKDNAFFYVRGVSVLFDEYSINAQYGLLESPDEHSKFVKTITIEGLNQVLVDLCVEGTKWTVSRNDYYIFDRVSLKPFLGYDLENEDKEEVEVVVMNITTHPVTVEQKNKETEREEEK
ncbi:hypothetical protein J1N35_022189 [Gossypium stocksii]|uniref:Uncharacterized protein n=1 Tax=Gossypium stocksii TaxID=47602 RepID=A0A9D3VG94_9ROSI|nr:hypothetical protein J1N35_022189 [Gossypium stocksii]